MGVLHCPGTKASSGPPIREEWMIFRVHCIGRTPVWATKQCYQPCRNSDPSFPIIEEKTHPTSPLFSKRSRVDNFLVIRSTLREKPPILFPAVWLSIQSRSKRPREEMRPEIGPG